MPVSVTVPHHRVVGVSIALLLAPLFASPAGAASAVSAQADGPAPGVTMTRLPALDGTDQGSSPPVVWDINNRGQIVGQTFGASPGETAGSTPTLWQDGQPMALPVDNDSYDVEAAYHVNERGQVLVDSERMPYLWSNGEVEELPVPNWEVVDVNDRGQVLIQVDGEDVVLWEDGELTPIRPPGDPVAVVGRDLSEAGHVVGGVLTSGDWRGPFIWQDGTFTRLGTSGEAHTVNKSGQAISFGTFWNSDGTATQLGLVASDLNDRGQVVGTQTVNGAERAVLWEDGRRTDLGTLGGEDSSAREINEQGQIVGVSATADDPWHNFAWTDGQMIDLGESWTDSGPYDINDHGQIIGRIGHIEGGARVGSAVLWELHDDSSRGSAR